MRARRTEMGKRACIQCGAQFFSLATSDGKRNFLAVEVRQTYAAPRPFRVLPLRTRQNAPFDYAINHTFPTLCQRSGRFLESVNLIFFRASRNQLCKTKLNKSIASAIQSPFSLKSFPRTQIVTYSTQQLTRALQELTNRRQAAKEASKETGLHPISSDKLQVAPEIETFLEERRAYSHRTRDVSVGTY